MFCYLNCQFFTENLSFLLRLSPDEVGEDDPVQFWKLHDKTDCKVDVLPDRDGIVVAGSVGDEGDVELAQPLLEQGSGHVRVRRVAALPLVESAFYTCHLIVFIYQQPFGNFTSISYVIIVCVNLIKVSRYSEDALSGEAIEGDDLVSEGCEYPGELPAWESVLLDLQNLLSSGKSAIIAEQCKIQNKKSYSDMRPEECRQTCLAERSVVLTDRYPQALAFLGRDDLRFRSALISCCRCRRSGRSGHKSCI